MSEDPAQSRPRSVCVIGAGAAGLTLAHALSDRGVNVVLVEGGTEQPPPDLEDTFRVEIHGLPHRGAHEGRFRAWGGSTTRWGGQLWPWAPHEFAPRPALGIDGWPLSYDEIARYYDPALRLLGIHSGSFTTNQAESRGVLLPDLDPAMFALKYSSWLPWRSRNLGGTVGERVRQRPNVETHLQTTARGVVMGNGGSRAVGVRVRNPNGGERVILSDAVIVAAGAIESARLLMSSARDMRVGEPSNWLGRGFMDHLSTRIGRFSPRDARTFSRMFAPVLVRGVQHTPRMLLVPEVLQREGLLGAYGHWEVSLPPESGLFLLREKLRSVQSGRGFRLSMRELRRFGGAARDLAGLARGIAIEGRRPFPRDAQIHLRVDTEQRPDAESRISLTNEVDALGLPRVAVSWRVSELEKRTIVRTADLLGSELERRGIGTLDPWKNPFESPVEWGELNGDSFHMMGGCRMAGSAEQGVVDRNSRIFGTDNVYVAGASVFPTGGMANPTLTLVALALRLADHLVAPD